MKKIFTMVFTVCFLCIVLPSMAQKPGKLISVGFGLEAGVPINKTTADVFNFNGGVTARFSLHAGPGFATFTTGGILFIPKNADVNSLKASVQIPIKAGYKYIFVRHFFVMGELGYSVFNSYYGSGQNSNLHSTSTGGFTFAPSLGLQFRVMELALRYESIQLSGGNLDYLGFRVGFNF